MTNPFRRFCLGALARLDALFNRVYTWRYNPLYHSGALVVAFFAVLVVTGLYLLLFYRIGSPYASVERITDQAFAGRWIRALHRYGSGAALVAAVVHGVRMGLQGRTWGPRALAWLSGLVLFGIFLVCGWTGYVMVWDTQAQVIALVGAEIFDVLPIFSEPIARTFAGERPLPSAFFFLNLFAHIAIPVGILLVLWIHLSRLARANVWPPRPLLWGTVGTLTLLAVLWPAPLGPEAEPLRIPSMLALDLFYGFWIPWSQSVGPGVTWLTVLAAGGALAWVPWAMKPKVEAEAAPSWVDPRLCTGCEQCYHDCPYEAIRMVARDDDRPYAVGLVDPSKCVSCGICAGSCAPMGVGPPGRTGRDQLAAVKVFIATHDLGAGDVVVVGCTRSAAGSSTDRVAGAPILPVSCAGNMHSSVVEYLVRAGAGGVMVVSCPPRDCWNREGVPWMEARLYEGREAELKDRVDRTRLRVHYAAQGERALLVAAVETFRRQLRSLARALGEETVEIGTTCEPPPVSVLDEKGP